MIKTDEPGLIYVPVDAALHVTDATGADRLGRVAVTDGGSVGAAQRRPGAGPVPLRHGAGVQPGHDPGLLRHQ